MLAAWRAFGLMSPSQAASTGLCLPLAAAATARAASSGVVTATGEYIASTASTPSSSSSAAVASAKRSAGASPMMSTGLPRDHCAGSFRFSSSIVASESLARGTAFSAALSAAITPGPPPFVMIASRSPCGTTKRASMRVAAKSCV